MLLIDVNVLVYAHRAEMPGHPAILQWFTDLVNGNDRFGVPELALSSFVRIVTRGKPFNPPTSLDDAFSFCNALVAAPRCLIVQPGARQWAIFERLCRAMKASGNLIPDAYFAAMALDTASEWVTTDRDFARVPGLTWRHPLSARPVTNPQ